MGLKTISRCCPFNRDSVTRFFASGFFHESVSPKPLSILLGPFRIFSKIRRYIRRSRLTTGINDTGGKFATGVNDTGSKIAAGINDTGGKFIYMLSLLSKGVPTKLLKFFWLKIFFICHQCQRHRWSILSCEYLSEFSKKFETFLIGHPGVGGKLIHKKTSSKKSRDTVPLSPSLGIKIVFNFGR